MSEATPRGHVEYDASPAIVLSNQARAALESATDLVIDSPTMYELASDELRQIKALQKTVEEKRTAITGPLNAGAGLDVDHVGRKRRANSGSASCSR